MITEYPCFEARNTSVKLANQNMKKDSNTTLIFMLSRLYIHTPRHTAMVRKVFTERHAAIILEGWVLNSVQWTSCTNPEGKLTTPMSKRDVAVRILSL